ncbi:MAG: class I SAM-dependent methyltransferase [Caldilineaceae bacterium]
MSKPTGQVRTNRMEVDRAAVDAVILKAGRDKPVRQRHPWIFSGAIQRLPKAAADGEIVEIYTAEGHWLARGYLNRASQIQVRILTWNEGEAIDRAFWQRRIAQAIAARTALATDPDTTVYRLINAESDYLHGLTVDRYDAYLVMQIGTLAMEQRKTELAELLVAATGARGVLERSEASVRRQEGLTDTDGLLAGEAPPEHVVVHEDGLHFMVDLYGGQKGGFYADQRENRRRVAAYCSGKRVLNGFSYTAAFAVHALAAGAAKVINIDSSVDALDTG